MQTGSGSKQLEELRRRRSHIAGVLVGILGFVLPSRLSTEIVGGLRLSITNYVWYLRLAPSFYFEVYSLEYMTSTVPLVIHCMRVLFAYQFMKFYQGRTTGKRTYLAAIPAMSLELIGFFGDIIIWLLDPEYLSIFTHIPLPFMLLSAILIMLVYPRVEPERSWIEKEPKSQWWGPKIHTEPEEATNPEAVFVEEGT